ncbi:MAG: hypothetical protein HF314_09130 [Ignavibacteria bacterium]|jgi:hypothetical protein|nr:hypothetical protein [Ignavibacteria bacterium]MCU7503224.1 hypothetical protein [Ignavibacteria bacterium]MCU7518212.1 hypothetical protein [Ignavibacteria bacterium]
MRLRFYIPVVLTAALSAFSGCYTVVEHPDVQAKDENGYTYNSKVYFYDDCASCHTSTDRPGNMTQSEHLSMFKAHEEDEVLLDEGYYSEEYYTGQYYYPTQYYGDYGFYYQKPWWSNITPPERTSRTRDRRDGQGIQYNGKSRDQEGGRSGETRTGQLPSPPPPPPAGRNPGGSSGGSGGSTTPANVQNGDNTNQNRNETRSSSENKNSNEQPKSRNNEGGRSSNSGRR